MAHARLTTTRVLAAAGTLALAGAVLVPAPASATTNSTADPVFDQITFGQSTDLNFSANVLPEKVGVNHAEPSSPGTIDGEIFMESRGGKLAPGHDGLTFYYVDLDPREQNFVLEADVVVHQLGPETGANPSGQEGAGLMVRDVNGGARQDPMVDGFEEVPAASNYAATAVLRDGANAMTRTGETEPWGTVEATRSVQKFASGGDYGLTIGEPVTMRLERTDDTFVMSTTYEGTGQPETFTRELVGADWVQDIDPDNMTVGFFASRNVAATFSNASLTLSDADTQPRPVEPEPVAPVSFDLRAPAHSGAAAYPLAATASHDGEVLVSVDGAVAEALPATAGEEITTELTLPAGSSTVEAVFTPSEGPSADSITRAVDVNVRLFDAGAPLLASPDGSPAGDGTAGSPLDIATAVAYVQPGQSVELLEGVYTPSHRIEISAAYSGTEGARKTLTAHDGGEVTIDGRGALPQIIRLDADHWEVAGLRLTDAASNGMRVSGSNNLIDSMVFNDNGDTGFQLTGSGPRENWPADNLISNSESHDNRDASDINADGFAAKLGVGPGNVFRANIAHHNIDDGWDLYNRTNEGANFPITLEGNVAYSNGKLSNGYREDGTSGSGFKVGGEGLPVAHVLSGNLAYDNNMDGFTDNFNPGRLEVTGNTAVDNKRYNFIFRINPYFAPEEQGVFRNNLSLRSAAGDADVVSGDVDATNAFFDGRRSVTTGGKRVVPQRDVMSLEQPAGFERNDDGAIDHGDFARPFFKSFLTDAGVDGGHIGAVIPAERPGRGR
ncbi:right-handed parallel beta-helix repeat-containing protein [Zhihengliuella halotolerans]|nr:right-handed parallel beta-helix repeat-containing protein [Zhihengliuella halotolerans]